MIAKFQFSDPQNWHCTLNFIGEVDESRQDDLIVIGNSAAKEFSRFPIVLRGMGAFSNLKKAHALWVGVNVAPQLIALHLKLRSFLMVAEFVQEERAYVPHVTLAKRKGGDVDLPTVLAPYRQTEFGEIQVKDFLLYSSVWGKKVSTYRPLRHFVFS